MKAVNELYKEGKFKRFGISNYMSCVSSSHPEVTHGHVTDSAQVGSCRDRRHLQGERVHPADGIPGDLQRGPPQG